MYARIVDENVQSASSSLFNIISRFLNLLRVRDLELDGLDTNGFQVIKAFLLASCCEYVDA